MKATMPPVPHPLSTPLRTLAALALCFCLTHRAAAQATPQAYYVNDASTASDLYCEAPGADSNDGLSPATPVASLQTILNRYTLVASNTVFIDAGYYPLGSNLVVYAQHGGSWGDRVIFRGAGALTVFDRQSPALGNRCIQNYANYVRFENLTFTGAEVGLDIDSSLCSYADIVGCTFYGNSHAGLAVQPSANAFYGQFLILRNLFHDNPNGLWLEPEVAMMGDGFQVFNNTVVAAGGAALRMGGNLTSSSVRNNILVAKGGGACFEAAPSYNLFQSDYNDLWAQDGGMVGKITRSGTMVAIATLADWQRFGQTNYYVGRDLHSFSRDPVFASAANADFHLRSSGGRWDPGSGQWVIDTAMVSPCIDAGDPYDSIPDPMAEPTPNGARRNVGVYGGTTQASKSVVGRALVAMAPDVVTEPQQPQPLYWNATGEGWQPGDTVSLKYSIGGGAWIPVDGGQQQLAINGAVEWLRPAETFASVVGCWVQIAADSDPACTDVVFLPAHLAPPTTFYVNDGSTSNDLFCTAAGAAVNDGLTPATPVASIHDVLSRYRPGIGATVYVDAGTYPLTQTLVLPDTGAGTYMPSQEPVVTGGITGGGGTTGGPSWFNLIGADRRTVLVRSTTGTGVCVRVNQDFTRIEGFTFQGGASGVVVDPQTCRNAMLVANTFSQHSGYGVVFLPDPQPYGYDTYTVANNLLHNVNGGLDLQSGSGYHCGAFTVENNTIASYNGIGIACGGRAEATRLLNNIVTSKGTGYCLSVAQEAALWGSDYNDFYPYGGAKLALRLSGTALVLSHTLADWQTATGRDGHSISRDPLFVNTASGDYHLRSAGGSWHNGLWQLDSATSPCIDAGDPGTDLGGETAPNGDRINLGTYGGTVEASRSAPIRVLTLMAPRGGEVWSGALAIAWTSSGSGWQVNDSVRLEYATSGASNWSVLPGAASLPPSSSFTWTVPNPTTASATYALRVVCNQASTVFDATVGGGLVYRVSTNYYVNDFGTNGDLVCSAPGSISNIGTAPDAPLPSLADVLSRYRLGPGDTVYVDTGTYLLQSNVVVDASHKGAADAPIRIVGSRGGAVFSRFPTGTDRRCLEVHADFLRIEGLTCTGAQTGLSIDASTARHVGLVGNVCTNNSVLGIEVRPYSGAASGEEFQLLQNVVVNNGAGLFLQGSTNVLDSRSVFVVENNTVYNGGTGIKILNASRTGKRINLLKNNIVETTNVQAACLASLPSSVHYSDFNNLRARSGGFVASYVSTSGASVQATFTTLGQWRAASGVDANSRSADSLFVSAAAGNMRLSAASPCVNAGIVSFWMFGATDADGNPRVAGSTADIGAYELNVRSAIRLFLQGPFQTGSDLMSNRLAAYGLLPQTSPYADDPRTAANIPPEATDWVLVQFRHEPDGPTVLSRSAFLRNDGYLVNDAGTPGLDVDLPPGSSYYVVIKHRNHLPAMSSVPVAFVSQTLSYDFTQGSAAFFGGSNDCVAVSGALGPRWALREGDLDGDGAVLAVDQAIGLSQSYVWGYRRSDIDGDGWVSPQDGPRVDAQLGVVSSVPRPGTVLTGLLRIAPSRQTLTAGELLTLTCDNATGSGVPQWAFVRNDSGASLVSGFDGGLRAEYTAGSVTGVTDVVEVWDSNEAVGRAELNIVGAEAAATAGQAIVIAGRTSSGDTLWPTTDYLADNAYATLRYRGLSKENVHYLSPEPNQDVDGNGLLDDIDGESTLAQAELLFTNAVAGADRLFVYLVDHGGQLSGDGYFRLSGSETITAAQLDAWLDALQDAHNTHVTVVLDFCYAGSFLSALTYSGSAPRIVIAACDTNQPSYFVAGGLVSFSGAFFSGVMLGFDVRECFTMAQSAMSTYQAALLDDDKDGLYTVGDGAESTGTYIGPTYVAAGDAPQIGEVCGNQVLTDETAATLWIGSVSSVHPITRAWCLVVPPGPAPDPDNPVIALPQLELVYDAVTGRYSTTYDGFTATGTYNVTLYVQDEDGNVSTPRTCYVAQIGFDDRVILVVGSDTNSAAWPAIEYLGRLAYATFRLRLFTPDHIQVLAPVAALDFDGDGTNDVGSVASLATLQAAVAEWAVTNSTDRLTLYMIGEGRDNTLRLGADSLSTNTLATWVHDYQTTNPVPVTVVLDFSGAGAFLPALADPTLVESSPAATRIAIASAHAGREALFANGGTVSFTQYLLTGVLAGQTLGDAYTAARRAIRRVSGSTRQQAQIDDNLNGEPSEKDIDGLLADETYLGSAFVTGADAPVIGSVIPPTVLAAPGANVTLWAQDVAGMYPVSNVWCVATPSGYDGTGDLSEIALSWNASSSRYEAITSSFVLPGAYTLTFYAEDSVGEISIPKQSEIILADAFEPDDTAAQAALYDGSAQIHTFDVEGDEDWVRVYLVTNCIYDIETYPISERLDTVLDLYRQLEDGTLELVDHVDEEGYDLGEYTGLDFPADGWYWARLTAYEGGSNTLGTYEFSVSIPSAAGLNTLIVLGVDDVYASALPAGSTVTVDGQGTQLFGGSKTVVFASLTNGTYRITVPTPSNFMPREDPNSPYQVQSLTNASYANPRSVPVSGGWRMSGFEMLSTVAVTSGVVRDAWTRSFISNADIAFAASSGSLTGTVVDGSVILTNYHTNWVSTVAGRLPPTVVLGACNWNLSVSHAGYQTNLHANAVSNLLAGAKMDLGTVYLVPTDTNANIVADSWEAAYFPGGLSPTADSDEDGVDNRSEYLSGTDPTNALSVLRFLDSTVDDVGADLLWSVAGGRRYQVLAATSLLSMATAATNGPWEATYDQSTMSWSDTNAPLHELRFYRIRLDTP